MIPFKETELHKALIKNLADAKVREELQKKAYLKKTRELMDIETLFITSKEDTLKAADDLYEYEFSNVGETSLERHRAWQVLDFQSRMDDVFDKIKNEKPIPLLTISDLDTER